MFSSENGGSTSCGEDGVRHRGHRGGGPIPFHERDRRWGMRPRLAHHRKNVRTAANACRAVDGVSSKSSRMAETRWAAISPSVRFRSDGRKCLRSMRAVSAAVEGRFLTSQCLVMNCSIASSKRGALAHRMPSCSSARISLALSRAFDSDKIGTRPILMRWRSAPCISVKVLVPPWDTEAGEVLVEVHTLATIRGLEVPNGQVSERYAQISRSLVAENPCVTGCRSEAAHAVCEGEIQSGQCLIRHYGALCGTFFLVP